MRVPRRNYRVKSELGGRSTTSQTMRELTRTVRGLPSALDAAVHTGFVALARLRRRVGHAAGVWERDESSRLDMIGAEFVATTAQSDEWSRRSGQIVAAEDLTPCCPLGFGVASSDPGISVMRKRVRDWFWKWSERFRRRRMEALLREFNPTSGMRILDIGGTDLNWRIVDQPASVLLLNIKIPKGDYDQGLRGFLESEEPPADAGALPAGIEYVLGDGKSVPYSDGEFDICFSNSTIEHLHTLEAQRAFAHEVRRVGRGVWLQTPARGFPSSLIGSRQLFTGCREPGRSASAETSRFTDGSSGRVAATYATLSTNSAAHAFRDGRTLSRLRDSAGAFSRTDEVVHRPSPVADGSSVGR